MNWIDRLVTNYCMIEWRHIEVIVAVGAIITICFIVTNAH